MTDRSAARSQAALYALIVRIIRFGFVSATGLALDYLLYALLVGGGLTAGLAYFVGASVGVTFVFVVSGRHVFKSAYGFRLSLFAIYCLFQAVSITVGAAAVGVLVGPLGVQYLLAKTLILPITFGTNFLFMSWLLSARGPGGRSTRSAEIGPRCETASRASNG